MKHQKNLQNNVKYNSTQWITLITLGFGNFCDAAITSLQSPLFPAEAEKKGANATEYGFIFGVYQLSLFVTAPIFGKLVPYISPKILLYGGFLTVGMANTVFGTLDLIQDTTTFLGLASAIRIIEGIGAAAARTSCYTIIAMQIPDGIGKSFALMEMFYGIGLVAGPLIGGVLFDIGGFSFPFYIIGAVVILHAGIVMCVLPEIEKSPMPTAGSLLQFMMHPSVLMYSFSVFTCFNIVGFNQATLEPHIRQFNLSGLRLGLLFALYGAVYTIVTPFWGWLSDNKCDTKLLNLIGCILTTTAIFIIGPAPFLNINQNIIIIIISLALLGIAIGAKLVSAFSGILEDTIDRGFAPDLNTNGLISSVITSSESLGALAGPCLGGYLLDAFGYRNASMALLIFEFLLVIFLVVSMLARKRKNKNGKISISTVKENDCSNCRTANYKVWDSQDEKVKY